MNKKIIMQDVRIKNLAKTKICNPEGGVSKRVHFN